MFPRMLKYWHCWRKANGGVVGTTSGRPADRSVRSVTGGETGCEEEVGLFAKGDRRYKGMRESRYSEGGVWATASMTSADGCGQVEGSKSPLCAITSLNA